MAKKPNKTKLSLMLFGVTLTYFGIYLILLLGAPREDETGDLIHDEFSNEFPLKAYVKRAFRELQYYKKALPTEHLLPDLLPHPYHQPKYTLILEFTDVLIHFEWTTKSGWRFRKRPMLDTFLESIKDQYEIILYTGEEGINVFPLMEEIDPNHYIAFKLVRDATYFHYGDHVKNLDNLNREISKVIVVDWNKNSLKFHPENLFCIKPWNGNSRDTSLLDLMALLIAIAEHDIEDVRQVLKIYKDYDDPIEGLRERQKEIMNKYDAIQNDETMSKSNIFRNFF